MFKKYLSSICAIILMAHMSVLSVASAAQADRKTLPDGTDVEALTPCELSLNVVDGVLKGITVKVADSQENMEAAYEKERLQRAL